MFVLVHSIVEYRRNLYGFWVEGDAMSLCLSDLDRDIEVGHRVLAFPDIRDMKSAVSEEEVFSLF